MLLGAVVGWGILSPLAKSKAWAPGPVEDWDSGSKGWIVWISLSIMLADSIISLGWLIIRPLILYAPSYFATLKERYRRGRLFALKRSDYTALAPRSSSDSKTLRMKEAVEPDAPAHHLVSNWTVLILLVLTILLCIFAIRYVFPPIPFGAIVLSILLALVLSLMGVRALGQTDLNPVSGISKITQLLFALVIPASNPNAIIINLVAGAISESGALQAGDLMQDLKMGHLLGKERLTPIFLLPKHIPTCGNSDSECARRCTASTVLGADDWKSCGCNHQRRRLQAVYFCLRGTGWTLPSADCVRLDLHREAGHW